MSSTNIDLIRKAYQAYAQGDVKTLLDLIDPDLEWTYPRSEPRGSGAAGVPRPPRAGGRVGTPGGARPHGGGRGCRGQWRRRDGRGADSRYRRLSREGGGRSSLCPLPDARWSTRPAR